MPLFICLALICASAASCRTQNRADETSAVETSNAASDSVAETEAENHVCVVYAADGTVINQVDDENGYTDEFSVYFFNVGSADAILIDADGKYYMIDTGRSEDADKLCNKLNSLGVSTIDAVFLTHTHSDHIGGFKKIFKNFKVGGLFAPCYSIKDSDGGDIIDKLAAKCGTNDVKLWTGDSVELCEGVYARVLGPLVYNSDDDNDNSLVLKVSVNGRVFLFTGDMQFAEEYTLMQSGADLSADVLKVGNHGNKDATSSAFAAAVSPSVAVITTDTEIDPQSAAKRVIEEFSSSDVYITGDCKNWLCVSVSQDSTLSAASG